MLEQKTKKIYKIGIDSLESKKIQNLLENPFIKEMTAFFISTDDIVFDKRSPYCCRMKCPNYNTRCYCPPYSLKYQSSIKNKNLAMIFVKTYDFSELTHFINNPEDYNEKYLFNKRVFVRRWVQSDFYKKIKSIYNSWGLNSIDIFAGGFCLSRCRKCYKDKDSSKTSKNCIPMPSPEALGIDVKRTLEKLNYYIKFGVMKRMTKVSMLFTDIPEYTKYLNMRLNGNDKPFDKNIILNKNLFKELNHKFKSIEFREIQVQQLLSKIKKEYQWLRNWKKALLWRSEKRSQKQIQNEIHKFVFMNNYYFALDFNTKTIFKEDSKYNGIEFF